MLLGALPAFSAPPGEAAWRVWLEPKFMHAPGAQDLPGAQKTQLAPGFLGALGLESFATGEAPAGGTESAEFQSRARENAAADYGRTTTRYERNRKKVIEYAEVRSAEGLVASAIFAPKFLEQFQETLGPTVLLVVPNRATAFVFPKLAARPEEYAGLVVAAYRATHWPVSLEIFELSATGLKAVGTFADPARP